MKNRRILLRGIVIFLCLSSTAVWGQAKPRVAILPFGALNVSQSDALVITSLFETSVVKTEMFLVIEQNQIKALLDAQKYSLDGCVDESCAVEVGRLLAAEQIILGELSRVGNRYIVNAKIIDVSQGRNIRADNVAAPSLDEIAETGVALLAYKLAGLTYVEGATERIAQSFGELFVSTEPSGAEVFINGIRRGISPFLVERVPLGAVSIVARKDSFYGEQTVELQNTDLLEISIKLEIALGRLFIRSTEQEVSVWLDGKDLGPLGSGLFRDIPAGERGLELKGEGIYWSGTVLVDSGKTVTVEAFPRVVGEIVYSLPEGARAEISGPGGVQKRVSGSGSVMVPVGVYNIRAFGPDYIPLETAAEIARGGRVEFSPALEYTDAYKTALAEKQEKDRYNQAADRIRAARETLEQAQKNISRENGDEYSDGTLFIAGSRRILEDLGGEFPDLAKEAKNLLADSLVWRIEYLENDMDRAARRAGRNRAVRNAGFITASAGAALAGITAFLGRDVYAQYNAAVTTAEVQELRIQLNLYSALQIGGAVLGAGGGLLGLIFLGPEGARREMEKEMLQLRTELAALGLDG